MVYVKAHSGEIGNERANTLAREATKKVSITWKRLSDAWLDTTPKWKDKTIDIPLRKFIMNINKDQILFKWTQQNRIKETWGEQINQEKEYDWKLLWDSIRTNGYQTSFKDHNKRSFWTKLLHNELPTLDKLKLRNNKIYENFILYCICKEKKETRNHFVNCKGTSDAMINSWEKIRAYFLKEAEKEEIDTIDVFKEMQGSQEI